MLHLFLAIALTSFLFLVFRFFDKYKIRLFPAVVVNYITCVVTGICFSSTPSTILQPSPAWPPMAIITGCLFLGTFFLIGYTVQKVSVAASTVANKISMVIPFMVNIFIFKQPTTSIWLDTIAAFLAIASILLLSAGTRQAHTPMHATYWLLPLGIFFMGGLIDCLINYINLRLLPANEQELFPIYAFCAAACLGILILTYQLLSRSARLRLQEVAGGIILGIPNYFSIYFVLKALSYFNNNGAIFFPLLNVGIILFSTGAAFLFFKDKLSPKQLLGLAIAMISIIMFLPMGGNS